MPNANPKHLEALLLQQLPQLLGDLEPAAVELLLTHLEWVEIAGGQPLMTQGEPGDAMYLLVSGRLRTYIDDGVGGQRAVREISRGQIVGEMSLYTDEPRSATLVAIRDSVLVRLGKEAFKRLISISGQVSIALTRQIIQRLQTEGRRSLMDRPVTIGLMPVSDGVDRAGFARHLAAALQAHGRVAIVTAADVEADLGEAGVAERPQHDVEANRRIALHLDEIEAAHDFVLLISDSTPTSWTQRCTRHCDEFLLLADAAQTPRLHAIEQACLLGRPARTDAAEILVLLHRSDLLSPVGTPAWLARRPVADHVHIRPALPRDMARLARLVSRTAVGLVLAGGGARGLAHLGVHRALHEHGVEIDVIGGTSIGAVMAAMVATDQPLSTVLEAARHAFAINPTGDYNWLPMVSLIHGRRLRRTVQQAIAQLTGHPAHAEDLWKGFFCVATNYSQARQEVFSHGALGQAILASVAIPGALPPVIRDGDLLCDGGTFNNFPVDVMRNRWGVGRVIGVDLGFNKPLRIEHTEMPGTWALLRDRFRPAPQRRYRLPSLLAFLMTVTALNSTSRTREVRKLTDLYFNPPLGRVGMLQWHRFDEIVEQGYAHACQVLDEAPNAV